jgi:xanthine/CO dehydrogenase XdhC/CoxF family maturation factor
MKLSTRSIQTAARPRGAWRNEAGRKPDLAKAGHGGPLTCPELVGSRIDPHQSRCEQAVESRTIRGRPMRRPPERRVGRRGEIGDARGAKARLDRLDVGGTGAGHVGRALAQALRLLHLSPRLIDQRQTELDLAGPGTPTTLSVLPEAEIRAAPPGAAFVILTHDHALDFLLAVEALRRSDAAYVGMIGSRTKRATFTRYAANEGVDARSLGVPSVPVSHGTSGQK